MSISDRDAHAADRAASTVLGALFTGYDLLDPGVVASAAWRPEEPVSDTYAAQSNSLAAVGILRGGPIG